MRYINQLDYAHVPYLAEVKNPNATHEQRNRTVALSGCGLCAACMIVDLLTDRELTVEECVAIAYECGSNWSVGTDMLVLAPAIAERYGLTYEKTDDPAIAVAHLQRGGKVIAHMGVPEGKRIGLFTKGGHYVVLYATDGERFCVLDPSYTPEKFEIPERAGKVDTAKAPFLFCDVDLFHAETRGEGRVKYHLFSL